MAGGGVKGGISVGETDELGAAAIAPGPGHGNGEKAGYHVKSLHATVLHLLGLDPNRLSYFFGGLDRNWLVLNTCNQSKNCWDDGNPNRDGNFLSCMYLVTDWSEMTTLAAKHPSLVQGMASELEERVSQVGVHWKEAALQK